MVLDERIQIPHYAVGWEESCSAKLGVQCSLWRNHTRKRIERASKKERGSDLNGLSLYLAREPPSTSLATVLAQRKRIGPSLAHRSRVELVLLPRLSLPRLSRTQSLFLFCLENHSFFTLLLLPTGSTATKVHIII